MDYSKPQLRKSLQEARLGLSTQDRREKSEAVAARLLDEIYWPKVKAVHCFEPVMRLGEVDLVDFVTALQTDKADIKVYTSRKIDGQWQIVDTDTDKPAIVVPRFDVIIVPMLGFDASLHRIGYGGGYYDKFLAGQVQAKKAGVCYELGRVDQLPHEPHDVTLDMIITETQTYTP